MDKSWVSWCVCAYVYVAGYETKYLLNLSLNLNWSSQQRVVCVCVCVCVCLPAMFVTLQYVSAFAPFASLRIWWISLVIAGQEKELCVCPPGTEFWVFTRHVWRCDFWPAIRLGRHSSLLSVHTTLPACWMLRWTCSCSPVNHMRTKSP